MVNMDRLCNINTDDNNIGDNNCTNNNTTDRFLLLMLGVIWTLNDKFLLVLRDVVIGSLQICSQSPLHRLVQMTPSKLATLANGHL